MCRRLSALLLVAGAFAGCVSIAPPEVMDETRRYSEVIELTSPDLFGSSSLERTLEERRSARDFTAEDVPLSTIGQLLWAGQGITDSAGHLALAPGEDVLYLLPVGFPAAKEAS